MSVLTFSEVRSQKLGEAKEAEKRKKEEKYNEILSSLLKQEGVEFMSDLSPEKASKVSAEAKNLLEKGEEPNREVREDREKKENFLVGRFSMNKDELKNLSIEAIDELMEEARTKLVNAGDPQAKVSERSEFINFAHAYMYEKLGDAYSKEDADYYVESFLSKGYEDWDEAKKELVSSLSN